MKRFLAGILLCVLVLSTGCWSKSEIEQLAFVMTIGIDKGQSKNYLVSFKMPKLVSKTKESGSSQSPKDIIFSFEANGIPEAADMLYRVIDKAPFFGQTRVIVISERVARDGINPLLDYVSRHYRLRRNINLLIGKGKVSELLDTDMSGNEVSAQNISNRIEHLNTFNFNEKITLGNFLSKLAAGKIQPVVPGERKLSNQEKSIRFPEKQEEVAVEELAVFKEDKLSGWLNAEETEGYVYTVGKSERSKLQISYATNKLLELAVNEQHLSKKVEERDGLPVIKFKFTGQAYLLRSTEQTGESVDPDSWADYLKNIEPLAANKVKEQIESAVSRSKQYNSDFFGFAQLIFRQKPELWRKIEPRWEEIFPELQVEVEAEVIIKRGGATISPPYKSKLQRNIPVIE